MTKSLKEKAISIKGKAYVLVSDRVIYFNENHPNGSIRTEKTQIENRVEVKATIIPDVSKPERYFTGHSQALWGEGYINTTSALENAETSAVGRALALLGIGVIDSIASIDEIKKAENQTPKSDLVCDLCGAGALISAKSGRPYCPNWKNADHKGVKTTMIRPKISDEKADEFFQTMPEEK